MSIEGVVAQFEAASLDEVSSLADLQSRIDRKYIVAVDVAVGVVSALPSSMAALEIGDNRLFDYRSLYFDTPDLKLYRAAAHRRRRQYKVRTRSYEGSAASMLEVKIKGGRGRTIKMRQPSGVPGGRELDDVDCDFVESATGSVGAADGLRPTLTTFYRRSTLVDRSLGTRTTLDQDVRCVDWLEGELSLDSVIIETKSSGGASITERCGVWESARSGSASSARRSQSCTPTYPRTAGPEPSTATSDHHASPKEGTCDRSRRGQRDCGYDSPLESSRSLRREVMVASVGDLASL